MTRTAETPPGHSQVSARRASVSTTRDLEYKVNALTARNVKLAELLKESRSTLNALKEQVEHLGNPPSTFGTVLDPRWPADEDDSSLATHTVDIMTAGRRMRVNLSPAIVVPDLRRGDMVRLNEALTVVENCGPLATGQLVTVREMLPGGKAIVATHTDEHRLVELSDELLKGIHTPQGHRHIRPGDTLIIEGKADLAVRHLPRTEVEQLVLEEVPDVRYEDIGGLKNQIQQIRDSVELPFLHRELYAEYKLLPPKGVLLYGPPGCGKTLIAKAVANSLASQIATARGDDPALLREESFFLSIKGPELLNKYVGETERQIRKIFQRARDKGSSGAPMIIFFDEMDSIFRTRGTGISSDVETTIVPQLLAELDGVQSLENVIVIGATNREDMIDPAILRPGRLDVKIKIERPDKDAAKEIFMKYLADTIPLHCKDCEERTDDDELIRLVNSVVDAMYATTPDNRFLELTYANGEQKVLYFKDFSSGAMIHNIVDRAKKSAIKAILNGQEPGIRLEYLHEAVAAEFRENEDLPNTTNPDDWARVSGWKGERIAYIRTFARESAGRTATVPLSLSEK